MPTTVEETDDHFKCGWTGGGGGVSLRLFVTRYLALLRERRRRHEQKTTRAPVPTPHRRVVGFAATGVTQAQTSKTQTKTLPPIGFYGE